MSKPVTLDVSEALLEQAALEATLTGLSVEAVLSQWLERGSIFSEDAMFHMYTPYFDNAAEVAGELREMLDADTDVERSTRSDS
jgi:hypothetical protein